MTKIKYSFIIPCFNEESDIAQTIEACSNQRYKSNYEIILIDDASTDKTTEIINNYKNQYNNIILIQNNQNKGVSYSRNMGIKAAHGEVLVFINADELPDANFLSNMDKNFLRGADYVFPKTVVQNMDTPYGLYRQAYRQYRYRRSNQIMWSQGFCCKKFIVLEVGMFSTEYPGCGGEDWDLVAKIDQLKYCRVTDMSIIVTHTLPNTFRGILWHMYNKGRGTAYFQLFYEHTCAMAIIGKWLLKKMCYLLMLLISPPSFFLLLLLELFLFLFKTYFVAKSIRHPKRYIWVIPMNCCNAIIRNMGYYITLLKGCKKNENKTI